MSKEAFEQANEVFVDDKYDEAYKVRAIPTIPIGFIFSHFSSFTHKQSIVMKKLTISILQNFSLHVLNVR